jgi:hypothetical protein
MSAGPAAPAPNNEKMAGPGTGGVQGSCVSSAAASASMERPSASSHNSSSAKGVKEQAMSDASAAPPSARSTKAPAPSSSREKEKVEEESPPRRGGNNTNRKSKADGRASAFLFGMGPASSAGSDLAASLDTIPVASAPLLGLLRTLGATAPTRAYGKMLPRSDRRRQQSRLLMSAKAWRTDAFPLDTFLSAAEWAAARGENGLGVLALDRDGEPYPGMTLKFLDCNTGYRVIGKWGAFLERNGLVLPPSGPRVSDVMLDLWVFRTIGGDLGLVLMHYRKGDAAHADAAFEEAAARPKKARFRRRGASSAAEQEDSVEEEVTGDDVDEELIPDLNEDVVMEDAADYDAARHEEEAYGGEAEAALPSASDAIIGATAAAEETTGSNEEEAAAVTVALAPNVNGEVKEDDAGGTQGKATPPSLSSANASGAADVAKASTPVSTAAGVDVEGAATRGRAAELASLLSSCKPDVLQAAETLMQIYRSYW